MSAIQSILAYAERLALRVLTRNGQRAFVLTPTDSAMLLRGGDVIPIFPTEMNEPAESNAMIGSIWLAALHLIAIDTTGLLNLETAINTVLVNAGMPGEIIETFTGAFQESQAKRQAETAAAQALGGVAANLGEVAG